MIRGILVTTGFDVKVKEYDEKYFMTIGADVGGEIVGNVVICVVYYLQMTHANECNKTSFQTFIFINYKERCKYGENCTYSSKQFEGR